MDVLFSELKVKNKQKENLFLKINLPKIRELSDLNEICSNYLSMYLLETT